MKRFPPLLATLLFAGPPAIAAPSQGESDLNGDGIVDAADLTILVADWGETFPATIDSVMPASGPPTGGTVVTITGAHLAATTSVLVGDVPATEVAVVSPTTVAAVTPPGATGPVSISVITPFGVTTLPEAFTFEDGGLAWATVLEFDPDPTVVTDAALRAAMLETGLPWRVRDDASDIEMLLVPPGTFAMGCSPSQQGPCILDENPVHEVTLDTPFYLGRHEVTQSEWQAVMGNNPSSFQSGTDSPSRPVEQVSWEAIQVFESLTGLRLPTEAEWEFACRAGTVSAFNNGSDVDSTLGTLAWTILNSGARTHAVGGKQANALGFLDMHGNVWEWCEDWYSPGYYAVSPSTNPTGPKSGTSKVFRGGSWLSTSSPCRSSYRAAGAAPGSAEYNGGFRAARTP